MIYLTIEAGGPGPSSSGLAAGAEGLCSGAPGQPPRLLAAGLQRLGWGQLSWQASRILGGIWGVPPLEVIGHLPE